MMSRTTARRRLGAAALATMAAALVVSPAGAASREPAGECPPGQRHLVAAPRAPVAMVAAVHEVRLRAETKRGRRILETRLAEAGRLRDAIRRLEVELELGFETTPRPSHPVSAAVDVLVDLARLPARAGLVAQHLLGAFAKVIPRFFRALL